MAGNNMFEEIKQHNALVRDQIYKGFTGGEELLEKARQVGDVHPNGKYVWTEYAPGKFDWRGIKKNAKEPKHETVEERTARFKNSKIVDGISKLSEEAQRSYKDIEAQVNGTAKRKSSNLWIRQELSDYIKANFQKVESNETGGTWQKVYGSNTDSKYGSYMVDIKNKRWRNTTKNEFYGGAVVD